MEKRIEDEDEEETWGSRPDGRPTGEDETWAGTRPELLEKEKRIEDEDENEDEEQTWGSRPGGRPTGERKGTADKVKDKVGDKGKGLGAPGW